MTLLMPYIEAQKKAGVRLSEQVSVGGTDDACDRNCSQDDG